MAKYKLSRRKLFTVKEVASKRLLDHFEQSVRMWLKDKDLGGHKVGKRQEWRIYGSDIVNFMNKYKCDTSYLDIVP
ncbi:MAG: helix-turn-helix domain-containing protein [candidate division Zixibacteria bacterium]|nr:helix-turn-helix domain-containing protein [candidate division Zixibacteria bacterium]